MGAKGRVLRFLIILSLSFGFVFPQAYGEEETSKGSVCARALGPNGGPIWRPEQRHWLTQLDQAHKNQNKEGTLYALLRLAQIQFKNQSIHPILRSIIQQTIEVLEANSFQRDYFRTSSSAEKVGATLSFLGLHHPLQAEVFGIAPYSRSHHALRGIKPILWDWALSAGPAMIAFKRKMFIPKHESYQNAMESVIQRMQEELTRFNPEAPPLVVTDLMEVLRQQTQHEISQSWLKGRFTGPLLIAFSFMLVSGSTPGPIVRERITELVPYSQSPYMASDFVRDIETRVLALEKKKNLLIYSDSLFPKINHRERPPMADPNIRHIDEESALDMRSIHAIIDLQKMPLGDYDNVIVLAHGHPDKLDVGLNPEGLPKLKEGANLIFYSCLLGQRGYEGKGEEQWVKFSRQLLQGGKAITATQTIYVELNPDAAGASVNPLTEFAVKKVNQLLRATGEVTGFALLNQLLLNLDFAFSNEFYLKPKGIRVFDSSKNEITYFPSQPPSASAPSSLSEDPRKD